ncbi:hypothetical protein [Corynebacterium sp. HS2168-gen11]|uniref:hypothetical protein n=1 Tax=Corynebacterium sp. HS2168-gen11 TaxID=2974027 RepID=UPI00216B1FEB|nr:hypothetical protein [Corynebacterium sp. HS2168-gen11]MCS4535543.1 hypothetical protein [Corynebacterium sp. HS2168-gen11]
MTSPARSDTVTSLSAVRAAKLRTVTDEQTLILNATVQRGDQPILRHIGINSAMTVTGFMQVLDTVFQFPADTPRHCHAALVDVDCSRPVSDYLQQSGDQLTYMWGLWSIALEVVDTITRDRGTPDALCIGAVGSFTGEDCDVTAINFALTGTERIDAILALANVEVAEVIRRSEIFDFVALLQAIDFSREPALDSEIIHICATLPVETAPHQREAFWSCVLALSCMSDATLTDHVCEALIHALGWPDTTTAADVREQCAASLQILATIADETTSVVDRIDIYRELLRR